MDPLRRFAVLRLLAIVACIARASEAREPSGGNTEVRAKPELTEPVSYEIDFSAVVTPPYGTKRLQVWMPLPPSNEFQQISERRLTSFPMSVEPQIATEKRFGNRFAYFEFHDPLGAQIVRHQFSANVYNVNWKLDPRSVRLPERFPDSFAAYLKPTVIKETKGFQQVLAGLAPPRETTATGIFSAMHWIDENLTYDPVNASFRADANYAFNERRGHCSDYHGLCATMGRTFGVPTRVTYGLSLYPKNSPSHCKLDAYLPPYGWVSFDLSSTHKMVKSIHADEALTDEEKQRLSRAARSRLQAGFRENSWLHVTQGTDYDLAPKASRPVSLIRTIYVEADGVPLAEPNPADANQREFGWMTVHSYESNRPVIKPFKDFRTLDRG